MKGKLCRRGWGVEGKGSGTEKTSCEMLRWKRRAGKQGNRQGLRIAKFDLASWHRPKERQWLGSYARQAGRS